MKISEIRDLTKEETKIKLTELKTELSKERALVASGTRPEKPTRIRELRRTIAKILTIQTEKKQKGER